MTSPLLPDELLALCEAAPETDDAHSEELWEFYFAVREGLPDLIAQIWELITKLNEAQTRAEEAENQLRGKERAFDIWQTESQRCRNLLEAELAEIKRSRG